MALVDRVAVALQLGQFRVIPKQFGNTLHGPGGIVGVDDPAKPVHQDPLADGALARIRVQDGPSCGHAAEELRRRRNP